MTSFDWHTDWKLKPNRAFSVLAALKAYNEGLAGPNPIVQNAPVPVEPKQEPTEGNENQGESLIEKVSRVAESAAEAVGDALEQERPKVSWAETLDQDTLAGEIPAEESSSEDEGGEWRPIRDINFNCRGKGKPQEIELKSSDFDSWSRKKSQIQLTFLWNLFLYQKPLTINHV